MEALQQQILQSDDENESSMEYHANGNRLIYCSLTEPTQK